MDIGLLLRLERVAIEVEEEENPFQRTIGTVVMGLPHRTDRTIIHITTVGVVVVVHPHRDDGNVEDLPDITMMNEEEDEEDHRHRGIIEEEEEDHSGEVMRPHTIPSLPSTVQGVP
jgi:hypothetical protein